MVRSRAQDIPRTAFHLLLRQGEWKAHAVHHRRNSCGRGRVSARAPVPRRHPAQRQREETGGWGERRCARGATQRRVVHHVLRAVRPCSGHLQVMIEGSGPWRVLPPAIELVCERESAVRGDLALQRLQDCRQPRTAGCGPTVPVSASCRSALRAPCSAPPRSC